MSDSQDLQWKRIAAEATAIVASILLAFWIDAWWDDRQNLAEEREILVGLDAEFVDLKERLDFWAGMNRDGIQLIEQFLSPSMPEMDAESVELSFWYSSLSNVLDMGGALDALLASGRLERISDRTIRVRLAKWPDWLEDIHTNDLSARQYASGTIVPFLAKHGIPRNICPLGELACPEPGPIPEVYTQLAADPEYRALITVRRTVMWFAVQDHEHASKEAEAILSLIRARVSELEANSNYN
jgi:hypothetical protein